MAQSVSTMVEGGKATTGPPLGPALGPLGFDYGNSPYEVWEEDFKDKIVVFTCTHHS